MIGALSTGQGLSGFLAVDKPAGVTSHDVVEIVRAVVFGVRVGHAGTLDPMATGVLVVAVGRATERMGELAGAEKEYEATIRFGLRTVTDDLDGAVVSQASPPSLTPGEIELLLAGFRGEIEQRAPDVSALKHHGEAFHAIVRRGGRPPDRVRRVTVKELSLRDVRWPDVDIFVRCGGGTYVRSIARDLGEGVGCGAALAALRRIRVGPFRLTGVWTLDEVRTSSPEALAHALRDLS